MSTIQHPRALVLDTLAEAGVSVHRLHETADRIARAYEELNASRPRPLHRSAPAESPNGRAE